MTSRKFLRSISLLLVLVTLVNLMPLSVFASHVQNGLDTTVEDDTEIYEAYAPALQQNDEEATILCEVIENRTEFSKEFRMSNGFHVAAIYGDAVHYEKNGKWEEIDNTLYLEENKSGRGYRNTKGRLQFYFPEQLSENQELSISKDGYELRFQMSGELHDVTSELSTMVDVEMMDIPDTSERVQFAEGREQSAKKRYAKASPTDKIPAKIESNNEDNHKKNSQFADHKKQSRLRYGNIYENTDIVFDLISNRVKESIILKEYRESL